MFLPSFLCVSLIYPRTAAPSSRDLHIGTARSQFQPVFVVVVVVGGVRAERKGGWTLVPRLGQVTISARWGAGQGCILNFRGA